MTPPAAALKTAASMDAAAAVEDGASVVDPSAVACLRRGDTEVLPFTTRTPIAYRALSRESLLAAPKEDPSRARSHLMVSETERSYPFFPPPRMHLESTGPEHDGAPLPHAAPRAQYAVLAPGVAPRASDGADELPADFGAS